MLEIEVKAKVASHDEIERKVFASGGVFLKQVREDDEYFNHPSRDFRETHEAFRIRTTDNGSAVTYKGPVLPGTAKSREESETGVDEPSVMRRILVSLGFVPSGRVVKTRREYRVSDCVITLDHIDNLGDFVEIERVGENKAELEKEVLRLAAEFGITDFERRSYLELVLAAGTR
jgi:adenylate cyclase class 2